MRLGLLLLAIIIAGVTADPAPCTTDQECHLHGHCLASGVCECYNGFEGDGLTCELIDVSQGSCSLHQGITCHEAAICKENSTHYWCECSYGSSGDGLKSGIGCEFEQTPCVLNDECHVHAVCNNASNPMFCKCKEGFVGDGARNCTDLDECSMGICSANATCQNSPGSYKCVCDINFIGDGIECKRTCELNHHCGGLNNLCNTTLSVCQCRDGFEGDPYVDCIDIDECSRGIAKCGNLTYCENVNGTYNCPCQDGYFKYEGKCIGKPRQCQEVKEQNKFARDGFFQIDPDGPGGVPAFEVYCDFQVGYAETVLFPKIDRETVSYSLWHKIVTYQPTIAQVKALIAASHFCYQEMRFRCDTKTQFMKGGTYWKDGNGNRHYTWGGASGRDNCLCGDLQVCGNPNDNCYCNGEDTSKEDRGKIINKDHLPITEFVFFDIKTQERGQIKLGNLKCAEEIFDIAKSCHEYKFSGHYWVRKDTPLLIDVDGRDGDCDPVLVHCDMERYRNVGISIFNHQWRGPTNVTDTNTIEFDYGISDECLRKAVDNSDYCSQYAKYDCKNSRLYNGGDIKGSLGSLNGTIPFFPGGMGQPNQCGCALSGSCDSPDVGCNCDIADGVERVDQGVLHEKKYLPITSAQFTEIGDTSTGRYNIGPLECSMNQFGIPPSCLAARWGGFTLNHNYLIDPDQGDDIKRKDNVAPFNVFCEFSEIGISATTYLYHQVSRDNISVSGTVHYTYQYYILKNQTEALKRTSAYCFQRLEMGCRKTRLYTGDIRNFIWRDLDQKQHAYFHGNGESSGCGCNDLNNCANGEWCDCDVGDERSRSDYGVLTNMNDIPMKEFSISGLIGNSFEQLAVGAMVCTETFPTCDQINHKFVPAKKGYGLPENGEYYIDPDSAGALEPFLVRCEFPLKTIIPIGQGTGSGSPIGGIETCFPVEYENGATPAQLQALVNSSLSCAQEVTYYCKNAPFTGNVTYKTCDGRKQTGWGESGGEPGCGCGVTGDCDKCKCDTAGKYEYEKDGGKITALKALPVCEVCFNFAYPGDGEPVRYSKVIVGPLVCRPNRDDMPGSCQDIRNSQYYRLNPQDKTLVTEVVPLGGPPLPVLCILTGLIGVAEIKPKNPEILLPENGTIIEIEYFFLDFIFMRTLIEDSEYCEQSIRIECFDNATIDMNANSVWRGADGSFNEYWSENTGGIGCSGAACNCGFQDGRGLLTDQNALPVVGLNFSANTGVSRVTIGALKCYDVYKDCDDIKKNTGGRNPPSADKTHPVDPDAAGGVEPFVVKCDFYTHRHMGITIIKTTLTQEVTIFGAGQTVNVTYLPSPKQINALTKQSVYCYQNVQFQCVKTALNSPIDGGLRVFGGVSNNFGAGDNPDVHGCACKLSGTCPVNHNCRCDEENPEPTLDRGVLLNKAVMPIQGAFFSGQTEVGAFGVFKVGNILCAPEIFDVPSDCEEARLLGLPSGDTLIRPYSHYLQPIMAYCDMRKDFAITIVATNLSNTPAYIDTFPTNVHLDYFEAIDLQLRSLVSMSTICYQPVKYECRNSKLLEGGNMYWKTMGPSRENTYFGHAKSYEKMCSCGHDGLCAGTPEEGKYVQQSRKCNCDTGDDTWRSDAGIISSNLPISDVFFADNNNADAQGKLSVGRLYCAHRKFDLDECAMGFHDCDENADCINLDQSFECRCREGFRAWGLDRTKYFATGRVCYDDNECNLNRCGWSADCENTVGSYLCHCKEGFTQAGPQTCQDIDECETGNNTCHENANCVNTPGSYRCRCKQGFRGNGRECREIGICSCFGDPHCRSFDNRWLHFQGACQYTLVRDNCLNNEQPTFEVQQKNWRRGSAMAIAAELSWVKEVTVVLGNTKISLRQQREVFVNETKVNLPYSPRVGVNLYFTILHIHLRTDTGLHVKWNGYTTVDVILPSSFKNSTCGLCGNYNRDPDDDWTTGPKCPPGGSITGNYNEFGQSWAVEDQVEDPECSIDCDNPPDGNACSDIQMEHAEERCMMVLSKKSVFKDCLLAMGGEYENYVQSCIQDLCLVGDITEEICETAKDLVNICKETYNVVVTDWRATLPCDAGCKENQQFTYCGKPSSQRYCVSENNPVEVDDDECEDGCVCPDGFMISGTDCVRPEECGCLNENNEYYSINQTVINEDCSKTYTCGEDHQITENSMPGCDPDEQCTLKDGVMGCYCNDGYMRADDDTCTDDPCYKHNCTENSECVESEDGYDCVCKMGFTGLCTECEDVDECATGENKCDRNAICHNTKGSYQCFCDVGLIALDGYNCVDKDECDLGIDNCDENAQCVNKLKGYMCVCCEGYVAGPNGTCIASEGDTSGDKCCACVGENCYRPGAVCGSDAKTYASERELVISACQRDEDVAVEYRGRCQESCGTVQCEGFEVCRPNPDNQIPECVCAGCTEAELKINKTTCDLDGNIFPTLCQYKEAMCVSETIVEVEDILTDECKGNGGGPKLGEWSEWSPCSASCGKGTKSRTRGPLSGGGVTQTRETPCYMPPCEEGPCAMDVCTGHGHGLECVEYDGISQCECPDCTNGGIDEVCAQVGPGVGTYLTACRAQRTACILDLPFEILHEGACGVSPRNCERRPYYVDVNEDDCQSMERVNQWTCEGGCGDSPELCCLANGLRNQTVDLECGDGNTKQTTMQVVTSCICEEE